MTAPQIFLSLSYGKPVTKRSKMFQSHNNISVCYFIIKSHFSASHVLRDIAKSSFSQAATKNLISKGC